MTVASKKKFGRYKILSAIGAGAMGEVFLAEDTRLERKVALKILPEKFTVNQDRLNRFVREAKAASSLNHPNIITIYEVGRFGGANFIATEFIDGETLRDILRKGNLSLDEVLSIFIQTAEALSAAHAAGIVHRDIKPENIMLRRDGYVKILDFGLAKLVEDTEEKSDYEGVTQELGKTNPGVVMGTISYMSPEQARGLEIDVRSDVFSFGIVLYEMISGRKPFEGETISDIIAAILTREPPLLTNFAPDAPKELQRIIKKTLQKKREKRYNSTRDLLGDLKDLREELLLETKLELSTAQSEIINNLNFTLPTGRVNQNSSAADSTSTKDALLLTEFGNLTGEAVFDATLKTALAFSLEQSPFLDIYPETKVRQTLRLMGRIPDERVTEDLGREICQRQGLKVYITGTISNLGTVYVLTLESVNARTGETIGRQLVQAESKEQVLAALGQAASGLREKLGESVRSIERFDAQLEYTTSSLEALKVYSMGREQSQKGKTFEANPFYKRAIELDPNFAHAYLGLAGNYANTNQPKLAAECAAKAFELRDRVSELEKLRIAYFYYIFVTGEIDKQIETLELYKRTYPRDYRATANLSYSYAQVGQFEKMVDAAREAVRLDSNSFVSHTNLAESLLRLNRFTEVREVCQRAFEQKIDNTDFHICLYQTAFIEGDEATMEEHLAWFSGQPNEYVALNLQTGAAVFRGEWRRSQDFSRRAIDLAAKSDAKAVAAQYAAEQALRIVFWSSGAGLPSAGDERLKLVIKTQTQNALRLERSSLTLSRTALALALAGQQREAERLADELSREFPKDTLVNNLWLPIIRAAAELQNGKAKEAIEELETAKRFERAAEFYPQYIRALAYLQLNRSKQAINEFDKILNHRGEAVLSALYPLARLGLARAKKDEKEYVRFFEIWKDADRDMPALVQAEKEFEKIRSSNSLKG
jgi:serine/threonine protein kinase/tetratricopeptide (TPR) repeat protein